MKGSCNIGLELLEGRDHQEPIIYVGIDNNALFSEDSHHHSYAFGEDLWGGWQAERKNSVLVMVTSDCETKVVAVLRLGGNMEVHLLEIEEH